MQIYNRLPGTRQHLYSFTSQTAPTTHILKAKEKGTTLNDEGGRRAWGRDRVEPTRLVMSRKMAAAPRLRGPRWHCLEWGGNGAPFSHYLSAGGNRRGLLMLGGMRISRWLGSRDERLHRDLGRVTGLPSPQLPDSDTSALSTAFAAATSPTLHSSQLRPTAFSDSSLLNSP